LRLKQEVAEGTSILVTFLWSTSFILIKFGLSQVPPLDFAAYRYGIASIVLLIGTVFQGNGNVRIAKKDIPLMILMAVAGYAIAQGSQYVGIGLLSTDMTAFLQNMTPVFVLAVSYPIMRERPVKIQLLGLLIVFAGLFTFLHGQPLRGEVTGVFVVLVGSFSWAIYLVLLRTTGVAERIGALRFTAITMSIGSVILLVTGAAEGGSVTMNLDDWLILAWLSLVNTAFAFYLWNVSLKVLTAFEMSVLQNTMLAQIALLSWYFLGEGITLTMGTGMILILSGTCLVQLPELIPRRFGKLGHEVLEDR
jgi:drug/metabolite transporter (DMT)-like permease